MGYRREEFRQLGVQYERRISRFEEMVPLLRELWTSDRVSHDGEEWQLDDAQTHVQPVQNPLPLWIGASTRTGVARSARLGDAWPIGPRMSVGEAGRALGWYYRERDGLEKPRYEQPIRREIMLGSDRDDAHERFHRRTAERFASYARQERASLPGGMAPGDEASTALLGSANQVCEELTRLAEALPVDPVIVRAQWPGMGGDDVDRYLRDLGRLVIDPMRLVPVRDPSTFKSADD